MTNEQVERLREALADMAAQHKCGCGHPSCNACRRDQANAAALGAVETNPSPAEPSAQSYNVLADALHEMLPALAPGYAAIVEDAERVIREICDKEAPAASSADGGVKCKTCDDNGKVSLDNMHWNDCPDCTPNIGEEKQTKCPFAPHAGICSSYFQGAYNEHDNCDTKLEDGSTCGYPLACHKHTACHKGDAE